MDERAGFEARAVLTPRRPRIARLALLVPAIALVAVAWAGVSGARPEQVTAEFPGATAVAAPSLTVEGSPPADATKGPRQQPPAQVIGLDVRGLDDVQPRRLGRDDVVAVTGWYVATEITNCPPLAAVYREAALPEDRRGDADVWAFCERSGLLYASRPGLPRVSTGTVQNAPRNTGLSAVAVTLVRGVMVPPELEVIGGDATEVVVVGEFFESADGCRTPTRCATRLVVYHVAWTPGA